MSCDWKSTSAYAQARRLLLLSLLFAGITLLLAATASAAYSVTVTPGTVLNTGTGNGAKLGINLDYWPARDDHVDDVLHHASRHSRSFAPNVSSPPSGHGMNTVGPMMQFARQTNMDIFMVAGCYTAGTGASRRRRPSSFSSTQSAPGTAARPSAVFRTTCSGKWAPMQTLTTAGWASGKASAAAGSVVPCRSQTAAMRLARSTSSDGAVPYS